MDDVIEDAHEDTVVGDGQMHELRNRLTVVKGVAQLLDRQVRRDDWQRDKIIDRLDRLQDEIVQLEHVLNTIDPDEQPVRDVAQDHLLH